MVRFVGRQEQMNRFTEGLTQGHGEIIRHTGLPGIGKSMLLRELCNICEEQAHPHIWLDLEGWLPANEQEALLELTRFAHHLDLQQAAKSLSERIAEGVQTLTHGLDVSEQIAEEFAIPGGKATAKIGKVVISNAARPLLNQRAQVSDEEAKNHPERYLLNTLVSIGQKEEQTRPVLFLDAYEHILKNDPKIQSSLSLAFNHPREIRSHEINLSHWLANLVQWLSERGWLVVLAGRNIPNSNQQDEIPRFSKEEILNAIEQHPALNGYLLDEAESLLRILTTLSFGGNPLWLQIGINLLEKLLEEGESLADLAAADSKYLQECFETEDPLSTDAYDGIEHGHCKLNLINRMLPTLEGMEAQAWRIALPRILDRGMVRVLFDEKQANMILHNFKLAGVFRKERTQFALHEEIRDLLLAYARSKGLLALEKVKPLHGKLWGYILEKFELHEEEGLAKERVEAVPHIWLLEACHHRCFSVIEPDEHQLEPVKFATLLMGSSSLTIPDKFSLAKEIPSLPQADLSVWEDRFEKEYEHLSDLLGSELMQSFWNDMILGKVHSIDNQNYWKNRVQKGGSAAEYWALILVLFMVKERPETIIQYIDELQKKFSRSADVNVQMYCAKALFNKGATLDHKLKYPHQAVATYDLLWQTYRDSDHPPIQEQCAKALFNKGGTLRRELKDPHQVVTTYDLLWQTYSNSDHPPIQEQCAKTLFNKGVTLGQELKDPDQAVATYDLLWQTYRDSDHPPIQEQCAKALVNKGITLAGELKVPHQAVTTFDLLWKTYSDSDHPPIQELCAEALFDKGVTLAEDLKDPHQAVATYDLLWQTYRDSDHSSIQEQCAKALVNQGGTLADELKDPPAGVAAWDEMLNHFGDSPEPSIQALCLSALENSVEALLVMDESNRALERAEQRLQTIDATHNDYAVMHLLRWIALSTEETGELLEVIRATPPEVQSSWNWNWDQLKGYLPNLPEPHRTLTGHFIAFFAGELDLAELEELEERLAEAKSRL
uniref:Orc1-like AAA ATPase domain-containing protein n=1 Tax=Magnetococcus massalia (strain MO-1) TaxID=451514 RepID=A0A1S7LK25_MAGMO|nr:protein of unknown function [Candidatus Magnetococcus massalia]